MMKGQMGVVSRWRASTRRTRIATLVSLAALVGAMAVLGGLPALAGAGAPSGAGVQPTEIAFGGSSGACDANFPGLPSAAQHELWIPNPADGTFTGPDGTTVTIDVTGQRFDFTINTPGMAAFDLIVKGGTQNTHYNYDEASTGPIAADTLLHAPTKGNGNQLYALSQINICYDAVFTNVTGTKFHDRDVDGGFDPTKEEGLAGWTIAVFDENGNQVKQTTTGADGSFQLGNLDAGNYIVCEATNTSGLPAGGTNWQWTWVQSAPANTLCDEEAGFEPGGYSVAGGETELSTDINFGNHTQVEIDCSGPDPVSVTLGGSGIADTPRATLTLPPGCASGTSYTTTFDVSLSEDGDDWRQIVTVSGDPEFGEEIIDLVVEWDSEPRNEPLTDPLVVPNTRVVFDETAPLPNPIPDATACEPGGFPNASVPTCLFARTIAEGGDLPVGEIQVTDHFKFIGDPKGLR